MAVQRSAASAGRAIYNKTIRDKVESTEKGKVVVIDVNSGDWEIDSDDATALFRLLKTTSGCVHVGGKELDILRCTTWDLDLPVQISFRHDP